MSLGRSARVACLILLCVSILSGCSANDPGATSPPELNEVKRFKPFRVYYAGENIGGLPLTGISKASTGRWIYWNFGYDDCDLPSGLFAEGGCSLPLSVQNWSTCYRWASQLHQGLHPVDFRGAKAIGGAGGSAIEIFTGRTTVVIFAHKQNVAKSAARQLRSVTQDHRPGHLPPPVPGSLQGKLPCQGKSG